MAVRRESVRLDVEGNFAQKVLEDAAAVEVLKRSLKDLSGSSIQTSRSQDGLGRSVEGVGKSTERTTKSTKAYGLEQAILDERTRRTSAALRDQAKASVDAEQGINRVRKETQGLQRDAKGLNLLWSAVGAGFPVVGPLGAVGAAGLAGIANDAGMAATSVASLLLALHGVMPALKAVNKAALEPTAANLQAASLAMQQLSPDARKFVVELQSMEPLLHKIQASAASGWFPGLTKALEDLRPLAPVIGQIFHDVGVMGGNLAAEGAKALAGPQWRDFFKFIDTEAPKAMAALGHVVGSLAHGLSQLWMAFSPLNTSFNSWLVDVAKSFDSWATGLSKTQGFHDFLAYVDANGPKVASAVEAIANAVIQIVQAAAPLGGPTLDAITGIAKALAFIANSPLGTPILLLIQMASVARIATKAVAGLGAAFGLMGKEAVVAEEEAAAAGGVKGGIGPASVIAMLGGTLATQGYNAASNALSPGQKDLGSANNINAIIDSIHKSTGFKGVLGGYLADPAKIVGFNPDHIGDKGPYQQADAGLAQLVGSGNGQKAAAIFAKINAQVADAPKYFPAYENALKGTGNAASAAAQKSAALRAANRQTADSFVNLASDMKKPTLSLDALVSRWRSQAAAEAEMGKNIATAIAKGANPEALSKIIDQLGPQAGLAIKQLATGGKRDIAALNTAFHTGQRAANVYNGSLGTLSKTMLHVPSKVSAQVQVNGIPAALSDIQRLRSLISGNPITQSVVVQRVGQVPGHNVSVGSPSLAGTLLGVPQTHHKADGGLMRGPGGPRDDLIPAMLSNREYVMPASAVDHYGVGFMDSLRSREVARFASGGIVGSVSGRSGKGRGVLTATELSSALQSLISSMGSLFGGGTGATTPGGQALAAMNTFAATIKRDGGHVGANFGLLSKQIAANATRYDTLNTKLQNLVTTQQSLIDGVKQAFTTDVFNQPTDLSSLTFGGGKSFADLPQWLQDSFTKQAQTTQYANIPYQLATDSANASNYADELRRMRKNLGQGYADVAGSNDQGFVDWLSHQSAAVQRQYGHAFASRDNQVQRAATSVGAGMGPQLAAVRSELAGLRGDNKALLKRLEDAVHGTVSHKVQADQANLTGAAVGKAVNRLGPSAKTQAHIHAATKPGGRQ